MAWSRSSQVRGWLARSGVLVACAALALGGASLAATPAVAGSTDLRQAHSSLQPRVASGVKVTKRQAARAALTDASALAASSEAAPSPASCVNVSVAPGTSPAGYMPLSLFGVDPLVLPDGDESMANATVPPFSYNGIVYNRIGISTNGYVQVGGAGATTFRNQILPEAGDPDGVLAPFWTDLNPGAGGAIRVVTLTDGADSWIVVDWDAVREFSQPRNNSFEIWIGIEGDANSDEDITFVYEDIEGSGDNNLLTVGAENNTGTAGGMTYHDGVGTLPALGTELRITSGGGRPIADFTATPTTGDAPLHVDFDGTASRDDGSIASYDWDFGDGSSATGVTAGHDYAPGSYTASLTVTDDQGGTCTATRAVVANGGFSIDDVSVNESAGTATFTVSRQTDLGSGSVDVSATPGTATTPEDFTFAPTTVQFAPHESSKTVDVAIAQDSLDEDHETYTLTLSAAVGGGIVDGTGQGTVLDDDPPVKVSVNDVNITEPNTGTQSLTFRVRLNRASGKTVQVRALTADGSAKAPGDYDAKTVTLTFAPGQRSKTVSVAVRGDRLKEPNETMFLLLDRAVRATLLDPSGTGGIINND